MLFFRVRTSTPFFNRKLSLWGAVLAPRTPKVIPRVAQGHPKAIQSDPKGDQRSPKAAPRDSKRVRKGTVGSLRGSEMVPKGALGDPLGPKWVPKDDFKRNLTTFWIKNNPKIYKNRSRNNDRPKHMHSVILNNTPMKMLDFRGLLVQKTFQQ